MSKLVTIFGGSGFLGRQVARVMARNGWRVRVAVRRPDEALFTRTYGAVGQVVPILCNIRDEASVRAAMMDADAVVNCVNILRREGKSNFDNIFVLGAENIARLSKDLGVEQIVHISGIGVDPDSDSKYIAAKAEGETAVLKHRPDAVVLRPSVMFGPGDRFLNRIGEMAAISPILPVVGAKTRLQPVFVDDVAHAAALAAEGKAQPGIYELGGPEIVTMREIARQTLLETDRRRAIVGVPLWVARIGSGIFGAIQALTGGIVKNPLPRDQLILLSQDNLVDKNAKGFADLGIEPLAAEAVVDQYLWPFRPSGQYDAIKRSAKNLRPL
ncbi:complex I NDUFA9 subunit family protein [Paracoccus sp. 11-3]|uniref:Complex I NDUFA9 subunit family protein n=1 Tax=Paracoccus amoyensis TaxID=2760093 RepID=A0A926GCB5_9RHOB|nr:complex I NDUFA9 subunit family protein [Paracoccus amoyensis]MBC9246495.1 complex I NDUFA9 subunit family protein [Paracoccus amoyensis]